MDEERDIPCTIVDVHLEIDYQKCTPPAIVDWETGALKVEKAADLICSFGPTRTHSLSGREICIQAEDKVFKTQENSSAKNFNTFVAVRNKKTNKMRLFLAENLFAKQMSIYDKSAIDPSGTNSMSSRFKNMQDLKRAFGSKRSKRRAEQEERMRMNLNQLNESINEAITDNQVTVEDVNIQTAADFYKDILPPCNRKAEKVEDVYNVDDIIDQSELDDFQELAEEMQNATKEELNQHYSRFVNDMYGLLTKPVTLREIKILLFADTLVQLAELKTLTTKAMTQICPSQRILQKLKDAYTVNSQKTLSRIMQDKIICHIFVLVLLTCNFKIFYTFLNNCSPIFRNKQSLLRIIGATPILKNNDNAFMLRLPLPSLPTGTLKVHHR